MRPWDLDDCEVGIAQLKEDFSSLQSLVWELQERVTELEDAE